MREKRIHDLFDAFTTNLQHKSIEEYFNLPGKYKLIRESIDVFSFNVEYEYIPKCNIHELCIDVTKHIASFLYTRSRCNFRLIFPTSYPFKPTEWSIISIKSNENPDFYKALTCQHQQYQESWIPSISIETDILNMILQLICVFHL